MDEEEALKGNVGNGNGKKGLREMQLILDCEARRRNGRDYRERSRLSMLSCGEE